MKSTGIVIRSMRRTDGAYGLVVKLEIPAQPDVYVWSAAQVPDGKRVSVVGSGAKWELAQPTTVVVEWGRG